jgi:ATP-dependent DNA helicase RecG
MFKAGFIDTWGRGYKKIRDGFEAAGIPMPKVQNFCGGVQVTVMRTKFMELMNFTDNVGSDDGSDVGSLSVVQLTERQRKMATII